MEIKKHSFNIYQIIEISLIIILISTFFIPYAYEITPFEVASNIETLEGIFHITIPLLTSAPLLLTTFFSNKTPPNNINFYLLFFSSVSYITGIIITGLLIDYKELFYLKSFNSDDFSALISLLLSICYFIINLKFEQIHINKIKNILIAHLVSPSVVFFIISFNKLNFGAYLLSFSVLMLIILSFYKMYNPRKQFTIQIP